MSLAAVHQERHEFDKDFPANQPQLLQIFEELPGSLAQVALPVFIVDSHDDIVSGINQPVSPASKPALFLRKNTDLALHDYVLGLRR